MSPTARDRLISLVSISVFFVLVIAAGYARSRSLVTIGLSAYSGSPGRLQLFHDANGRFREDKSDWIDLDGRRWQTVSITVAGADATQLRMDPAASNSVTVCGLGIHRSGESPQVEIIARYQVDISANGNCLVLHETVGADDPSAVVGLIDVSKQRSLNAERWRKAYFVLKLLAMLALACSAFSLSRTRRFKTWFEKVDPLVAWCDRRAHWIVMALMLGFGTLYAVLTPPGAVADEEAHLAKIVRVEMGVPFGDSGRTPMPDIVAMLGQFRDYTHNKASFTVHQVREVVDRPLLCLPQNPALPRSANGYSPLPYLAAAIVFKAGCAMGSAFGTFLYIARFLNLLLGTVLVAWGIRHAVRGKWALFLIALLPMTLFQISSVSADSLTLAASLAWLGLLSGIEARTLHPRRAAPWLLGLALGLALLKPGSAWVLLGLIFCKRAFDDAKVSFPAAVAKLILLPFVVHLAWLQHAAANAAVREGVDPVANQARILHEPSVFLRVLVNTFTGDNLIHLEQSMIGVLGWLDVVLVPWAYGLATICLLLTLFTNDRGVPAVGRTRAFALVFALGSLMLASIPLYLFWTLPTAAAVEGLQGRYFTISIAFVLVWCSFRPPQTVRSICVVVILSAAPLLNGLAIHQLIDSYYINGRPG